MHGSLIIIPLPGQSSDRIGSHSLVSQKHFNGTTGLLASASNSHPANNRHRFGAARIHKEFTILWTLPPLPLLSIITIITRRIIAPPGPRTTTQCPAKSTFTLIGHTQQHPAVARRRRPPPLVVVIPAGCLVVASGLGEG